jgi:AraC family transcriptional activator of pobA
VGFVPSGVVHTHLVEEGADAIVMSMSNDALHAIAPHTTLPLDLPTFCVRGEASAWRRLAATVEAISEEYADQMPGAQAVLLSLMAIALTQIARLRAQGIDAQPADSLVLRLRRTIDQHYRDRWRLADYVAALGTTEHLLDSAARRTTGLSVNDLVMERRVLEAKRLLMFTNRAVEDIAYELGFGDPSYFTRFFRRRAGATPSAWRAERQARR